MRMGKGKQILGFTFTIPTAVSPAQTMVKMTNFTSLYSPLQTKSLTSYRFMAKILRAMFLRCIVGAYISTEEDTLFLAELPGLPVFQRKHKVVADRISSGVSDYGRAPHTSQTEIRSCNLHFSQ